MITPKKSSPPPKPLAKRICMCGCKNEFQPGRKADTYLFAFKSELPFPF
jgi:hypothetical protein